MAARTGLVSLFCLATSSLLLAACADDPKGFIDTSNEGERESPELEVTARSKAKTPDYAADHGEKLPALNTGRASGDPGSYQGGGSVRPGPGPGPGAGTIMYSMTPPPDLNLDGTDINEGQFTLEEVTAYRMSGNTVTADNLLTTNQDEIAVHAEIGTISPKDLFELDDDVVALNMKGYFDATIPDLPPAEFDVFIFGSFLQQTDSTVFLPSLTANMCVQVTGLGTTANLSDNADLFLSVSLSDNDVAAILQLSLGSPGFIDPTQAPLAGNTCATAAQMTPHGTARNQVPQACDSQQVAGADTPESRTIEMGSTAGTVQLNYNTYSQQDRVTVLYEGATLFDSGCVGTSATQLIAFSGNSSQITVSVAPNCAGGTGTAWDFTLSCPN